LRELKKSHSAFERLHANHFGHEKNVDMASSPEEMKNEVIENQDIEEESNLYFKNHLNCFSSKCKFLFKCLVVKVKLDLIVLVQCVNLKRPKGTVVLLYLWMPCK